MKVLILGGSGFIGSHIVDKFLTAAWDVTVYDQQQERFRPPHPSVQFIHGEFSNKGQLEDIVSLGFDVIIHSVGTTNLKASNDNPEYDVTANVIATLHLLEVCKKYKTPKMVFISSGGTIYGDSTAETLSEKELTMPICSYAISKLTIEKYLFMYHRLHGLNYVSLRLSNPYGMRQNPFSNQGALVVFLHRIISGEQIELWGDGSVVRDFIFVGDVANACYLASAKNVNGIFNIGSSEGISIKLLIEKLSSIANRAPKINWLPNRPFDVQQIILDCSVAKRELGWTPKVGLDEGAKLTYDWLANELVKYLG
jgi:UDP-glucose 4-epimerase